MKTISALCLQLFSFAVFASEQPEQDSLRTLLATEPSNGWQFVDQAGQTLIRKDSFRLAAELYFVLGEYYELEKFSYDTATGLYERAAALYQQAGNSEHTARAVQNKAMAQASAGDWQTAIESFRKARKYFLEAGNSEKGMAMYSNMGNMFSRAGQFDSAKFYLLEALLLCDSIPGIHCLNAQNNLGIVYMNMGDPEEAARWYGKTIPGYQILGDTLYLANAYNNLAGTHWARGAFDSCIIFLQQAEHLYKAIDDLAGQNFCLVNLGALYADQGEYNKSLQYSAEAIKTSKLISSSENLINAYINSSKPAWYLRSFATATAYLDSAELIAAKEKWYLHLANIYKSRVELAKLAGNYRSALEALEKQHVYEDSLNRSENRELLAEMQTKYESKEKEQQIKLQQAEIERQNVLLQRNVLLIAGLASVLVLMTAIFLLLRARARRRHQLLQKENELNLKDALISAAIATEEKERTRFARDLHDGFGQMISLLSMNMRKLESTGLAADRDQIFKDSEEVLNEMYLEIKNVCFNLMPKTLIQFGLTAGIQELVSRINKSGKIRAESSFYDLDERLADVQEISLYRIVQEWTNNILKYSDASRVSVQLTRDEQEITLTIEDDGLGFDERILTEGKGNGWKNLQSRANLMKGTLDLETSPGRRGNMLIVNVPVLQQRPAAHVAREIPA